MEYGTGAFNVNTLPLSDTGETSSTNYENRFVGVPISPPTKETVPQQSGPANTAVSSTAMFPERSSQMTALPQIIERNWSRIALADLTVGLVSRLVSAAAATERNRKPLSEKALERFFRFWRSVKDQASEPEIVPTPDGGLHAEWFKSPSQRLDIKFSESNVFFGLINGKKILEGAYDQDTVAAILKNNPSQPLRWGSG